jgi:hypothetical protein
MKRFRRWLFNGSAALSLLLSLASAVLWVRSCFVADFLSYARPAGEHLELSFSAADDWSWFSLGFGRIFRSRGETFGLRWTRDVAERWTGADFDATDPPPQIRLPGVRVQWFRKIRAPGAVERLGFAVQLWIPLLLGSILPLYWWRLRQRARRIEGRCTGCGYDLRATPDRCPECGAVPKEPMDK